MRNFENLDITKLRENKKRSFTRILFDFGYFSKLVLNKYCSTLNLL